MAHNFTVFEDFDKANGKFPNTLGNIVLIDCRYMNSFFETSYNQYFNKLVDTQPFYFLFLSNIDKQIKSTIASMNFCNYAMSVNGVTSKQVEIYTGTKKNMQDTLGEAGNLIVDQLSLDSNVTITTPLKT